MDRLAVAFPHPLVGSAGVAELVVSALFGDPAAVEQHDLVDLVEPVTLVAVEQGGAAAEFAESHQHRGQGGLAGPVGANQRDPPPGGQVEADPVQDRRPVRLVTNGGVCALVCRPTRAANSGISGSVTAITRREIQCVAVTVATTAAGTSTASTSCGRYRAKYGSSPSRPRVARAAIRPGCCRSSQAGPSRRECPVGLRRSWESACAAAGI